MATLKNFFSFVVHLFTNYISCLNQELSKEPFMAFESCYQLLLVPRCETLMLRHNCPCPLYTDRRTDQVYLPVSFTIKYQTN